MESKAEILETRKLHIGPNCEINYAKSPLLIVRGEGARLYDESGVEYLDGVNNVAHVGHSHPHVVSAISTQLSSLITNNRYLHPEITRYSKRLAALFPPSLSVMYWCNSGSEANDLALRLARAHTGRRGVICVDGAYHGHTSLIVDVSPYKYAREGGSRGERGYVKAVPQPDGFSGVVRGDPNNPAQAATLATAYAAFVGEALEELERDRVAEEAWKLESGAGKGACAATGLPTMVGVKAWEEARAAAAGASTATAGTAGAGADNTAATTSLPTPTAWAAANTCDDGLSGGCGAFIMESILSCGGQVVPPGDYLAQVYARVRGAGGVCIADEVQVGFGRTGVMWGFQLGEGSPCPDIVTLGKPIGNGFPCAAVVTTPAIAASFAASMEYFNTFAGNPCAGAAANAVLDVIEREGLVERARVVGDVLLGGLRGLEAKYGAGARTLPPIIGSVRGRGLMVGLEMIKTVEGREADAEAAKKIKYSMLSRHILISTDGEWGRGGGGVLFFSHLHTFARTHAHINMFLHTHTTHPFPPLTHTRHEQQCD
jgi:ethanolamine-phosphate phospho-lyase